MGGAMDTKHLRLAALHNNLALVHAHAAESAGNNRGPIVDKIEEYAGGDLGEPYCVDTVIWGYGHAGSQVVKRGYPRAVSMMIVPGVHITHNPQPGNIVRYAFDHTGLLVGWRCKVFGRFVRCPRHLATHIETVEGNTSPSGSAPVSDGQARGDGVHLKFRPLSQVRDFLYVSR